MKRSALAVLLATLPAVSHVAQDANDVADEPAEVTIGEQGSAQDPLSGRDEGLAVEPQRAPAVHQVEGILGVPALSVKIDPRTLGVAPGEPLPALRREGEAIRKRDGKLRPTADHGYAVFILDADPEAGDDKPLAMVLAPCMALEAMERLQESRGDRLRFTITGEVHTYRGVNYLLPTAQPKPWLIEEAAGAQHEADNDAPPDPQDATAPAEDPATPDTTGDPQANDPSKPDAAGDEPGATPSAEQVLEELLKQRRDAPTPGAAGGTDDAPRLDPVATPRLLADPLLESLDPNQPQAELKKEGAFLIARTGRLIRTSDGAHALFVLDADDPTAPEPPMIMQACKLLETMEQTVREQGDDVPFVVTGQVFVYRGANYLLPTIVKRAFENGNLE
ncbi:MAG: hypothetical protein ACE37H_02835 [Phycisphaeraceae bacterium]